MSDMQLLEQAIQNNDSQACLRLLEIPDYSKHLLSATRNNLYDVVKKLIEMKTNINTTNESGETSLFLAVKQNNYNLCKLLLENNIKVNHRRRDNVSCLRWAIEQIQNIEIIKLLIFYKSNLEETDENNNTLLMIAYLSKNMQIINNMQVIKLLIDSGANINAKNNTGRNLLILSCLQPDHFNSKVLKLLILNKVNVNEVCSIPEVGYIKKTYAILEATKSGAIDQVNLLIQAGANLEVTDTHLYNKTPLIFAIGSWHEDLVEILINAGANVNCIIDNYSKISAIMFACSINKINIFKLLLQTNKIDLNYVNSDNENIYEYVVTYHSNKQNFILELLKFMKNKNILINSIFENNLKKIKLNLHLINEVDSLGNSPLYYATLIKNNDNIKKILLNSKNVNLFSVNNKNVSIFDLDNKINKVSDLTKLTQKKLTHNYNIASCELLSKYLHQDVINNIIFKYITKEKN
jgi:ankyrin repeat protein